MSSESEALSLPLSKGHNRVVVSIPSLEDGNRSSLRNTVFSSYVEFTQWFWACSLRDSFARDKVEVGSDAMEHSGDIGSALK
jgi:hypothetical protein